MLIQILPFYMCKLVQLDQCDRGHVRPERPVPKGQGGAVETQTRA